LPFSPGRELPRVEASMDRGELSIVLWNASTEPILLDRTTDRIIVEYPAGARAGHPDVGETYVCDANGKSLFEATCHLPMQRMNLPPGGRSEPSRTVLHPKSGGLPLRIFLRREVTGFYDPPAPHPTPNCPRIKTPASASPARYSGS